MLTREQIEFTALNFQHFLPPGLLSFYIYLAHIMSTIVSKFTEEQLRHPLVTSEELKMQIDMRLKEGFNGANVSVLSGFKVCLTNFLLVC